MFFFDRQEAGEKLAEQLTQYKGAKDVIVLGLARGGVVTAAVIADALNLPLSVAVVRKLGAPGNPELAIGAVCVAGEAVFNERLIALLDVTKEYLLREVEKQRKIAKERTELYFRKVPPPNLEQKTILLVDDGIATGASMKMAIRSMRAQNVKEVVLVVPVAAPDSLEMLKSEVDHIICLHAPLHFEAIGAFYKEFGQVDDDTIIHILSRKG